MSDLISIIVNIHNNEETLKNCIVSLISQTYREIEIILIDDGSTDSSGKICDDLILTSSRMKVVHKMHSGIGNSRNSGLDIASGKYITFVNATDTLKSNMIEELYKIMQNYPVEIAICSVENKKNTNFDYKTITLGKEDALRQLLLEKSIKNTIYGKLFKRELFNSIRFSEDNSQIITKLFELSSKVAFTNNCLYICNLNETFSRSSLINNSIRIMQLYPNLKIQCQYSILKNIQDEFYECFCNNKVIENQENMYKMFIQIVKDNEERISPFLSYIRKAHMYLLADNYMTYKRICPVLPELSIDN